MIKHIMTRVLCAVLTLTLIVCAPAPRAYAEAASEAWLTRLAQIARERGIYDFDDARAQFIEPDGEMLGCVFTFNADMDLSIAFTDAGEAHRLTYQTLNAQTDIESVVSVLLASVVGAPNDTEINAALIQLELTDLRDSIGYRFASLTDGTRLAAANLSDDEVYRFIFTITRPWIDIATPETPDISLPDPVIPEPVTPEPDKTPSVQIPESSYSAENTTETKRRYAIKSFELGLNQFEIVNNDKGSILVLSGWGYVDDADFDGEDCLTTIVIRDSKGKRKNFTVMSVAGATGIEHVGAGKNMEAGDYTAIIDVFNYPDGDYQIGLGLNFKLKNKSYSYMYTFGDAYNFSIKDGVVVVLGGLEQ